jgi:hypothetical protein
MLYPPLARKASKLARILCDVRLWHDHGDYYEIHDYEKYQDAAMKDQVEARRDYERMRKREQREAKGDGVSGGKVYFIRCGDSIKIGFSKNPWSRLSSLKTGSPGNPQLLGYMPGSLDDERAAHEKFAHLRENREWFRAEPDLLDFIATVATTCPGQSSDYEPELPQGREGKGRTGQGRGSSLEARYSGSSASPSWGPDVLEEQDVAPRRLAAVKP